VILSFMPALTAGYVDWDDTRLLDGDLPYRTWSLDSVRFAFTTTFAGHYQPLTWLSHTLDRAMYERSIGPIYLDFHFGSHLTSVVLHGLSVMLVFAITRRLLTITLRPTGGERSWEALLSAALAAVVFGAHPLRAESVAWLAERRDVLCGVFCLASVWFYLRYAIGRGGEATSTPASRRTDYVFAIAMFGLSLLAKASAVPLGLALLVIDWYPLRRMDRATIGRLLAEKVPFLIIALVIGLQAIAAQSSAGAMETLAAHDFASRAAQALYGLAFYPWKTLAPTALAPLYDLPSREVLIGSMLWLGLAGTTTMAAAAWLLRRRAPGVTAALLVYAIMVAPVLGFFQSGTQLVADRYSYLPCIGFAVLAGAGMLLVMRSIAKGPRDRNPLAFGVLVSAVLVAMLSRATMAQADIWVSAEALWRHATSVHPASAVSRVNYADALARRGDLAAALAEYRAGLELDPLDAIAWHHMGLTLELMGGEAEALSAYIRCLQINPDRRGVHALAARLLLVFGDVPAAMAVMEDGARRTPDEVGLLRLLVEVKVSQDGAAPQHGADAVAIAERLMTLRGGDAVARMTLATALASVGRFEDAVALGESAVMLARQSGQGPLEGEIAARLVKFQNGSPWQMPLPAAAP
jgi:tetratricopeptide (TPR) repeat protein